MLGSTKLHNRKSDEINHLAQGSVTKLEQLCHYKIRKIRNDPSLGISKIKAACIEAGTHGFGMAVGPFITPGGRGYILCARSANSDNLYSWISRAEELLAELNEIHSRIKALKNPS